MKIKIKALYPDVIKPQRAYPFDAGLDLFAHTLQKKQYIVSDSEGKDTVIEATNGVEISTGLCIEIPEGFVGILKDRSSMGLKGFVVSGGVIDAGYTGEIKVMLWSVGGPAKTIKPGDKVAQLLILPVALPELEEVTELSPSERGDRGFGSSDVVTQQKDNNEQEQRQE